MARINDNANGNRSGKYPARASLGEMSPGSNLNGGDDDLFDEVEANRMGHTRNDQRDMSRMGKRQDLIVSLFTHTHTHTHLSFSFFCKKGRQKKNFSLLRLSILQILLTKKKI